jgi:hypothetical protein
MKKDDSQAGAALDISVFEIPPAAAYFETIQQLQKVNAKLDVLIRNQCEMMARLNESDVAEELRRTRTEIAQLYEAHLVRYFDGTDLAPEAIRNTIHPDDRPDASGTAEFRNSPLL